MADGVNIRPYLDADEPAVLAVLSTSLGWVPDGQHTAYFRWKHIDNAFGRSAMWVAEDDEGTIIGFRSMMRWAFHLDGEVHQAVRAVDTATHPSARGKGIFRTLTMHAVDELKAEGVSFVFNTPNDQSRPGYLKMGWEVVGRPPAGVRPSSPAALMRMVRSRVPADLWSEPTTAGTPVPVALADATPPGGGGQGLRTAWTASALGWRFDGLSVLGYRAVVLDHGVAIFRLRRRGRAVEAVLCATVPNGEVRPDDPAFVRAVSRLGVADYVLRLGTAGLTGRELPLPGGGPVLTWRALRRPAMPPLDQWQLTMGDIELL